MLMLLDAIAALLYFACAVRLHRLPAGRRDQTLILAAAAAITAHGLAIGSGTVMSTELHLGVGQALSLFLWQCAAMHLLFSLRWPLWHLGAWLWPITGAIGPLAWFLPEGAVNAVTLSTALKVHILLSILAYAALTLAALQTLSYALLDKSLRRGEHRRDKPPLQVMEDLVFRLVTLGFILLCASIASGFLFVDDFFAQHLAHKTILSIIACALFGGLVLGRQLRGWRGRIAIRWTLSAYVSLLLAYFGSKLVLEQILGKSWS
jgi:ABC-type uncharacterized transport system permease subunit